HLHVRELDGKGSKRLSKFNELIAGVRKAVPDMIIQVGGSISFAPESEGEAALWLSDEARHMLADLTPKPDQVTIAINTTQMNITEVIPPEYLEGTTLGEPGTFAAYREMTVPAGPGWVEEHLRRLQASGIQPHFQLTGIHALETVERLVRKGIYTGPLNLTWIGIAGGFDGPNPFNFFNFIHRAPDGCTLTSESLFKNVLPFNTMALSMGLHPR
ncbi:3-keto-5-aminohexanoate cleavage protein, partial [Acinetobacter sp. ULE_I010]|uniref:3-keto-5-aminohexanoate cleavage protein n=1 Tax=Acinetobacter sp. ULE_I010 TaxID=3373065 RepID=UPI003AF5016D